MRINLNLYIEIIEGFLNKIISPKCFEYIYMKIFLKGPGEKTAEEFSILNGVFMDVEAFCDNPELMDKYSIDELELRKRCKVALEKLKHIQQNLTK